MKQLMVRPMGQFVILATLVFSQFVFAGDYIRGGGDPTVPNIVAPNSISNISTSSDLNYLINEITIDVVASDLMINFNSPIGIATVSINDINGNIAYQTTVDTNSTSEVIVPIDLLDEGNYTVTVTYGSTVYTEQIQL